MNQPVSVPDRARPSASQVFVDDSGRRSRWARRAGALLASGAAIYIGVVVVGLTGPRVGPVVDVPATGNDVIPGLVGGAGTVPGLLAPDASTPSPSSGTAHGVRRSAPIRPTSTAPAEAAQGIGR
jgi:hypothetical protein